ncbi:Cysteine and histidine-rich domain-containing protein 1 [Grifola frondosa]|uniref:Cysteine and histidine-rich domain-containing protein 1 n=1 Tax=Grifola frondosa TaxID=5627 RepID=A0A1C7MEU7_GRIFR|nr:Cysteine and histidine-rich domain-containing protein 1 [Grifola frondosa]
MTGSEAGKETYSSAPSGSRTPLTLAVTAPIDVAPVVEEEEDDLSVTVSIGEKCRHSGCKTTFESDEVNRQGDGEGTICWYHPKPPIFHEGSKGYLCCKRRVLEFDEFMKIEGCTKGRHVFVAKAKPSSQEQFMECRIDHYQTPTEVHVSVFAKQADREQSTVKIEQNQIHLDVSLPASKRFRKSIELFGPVDPTASSVKYYGTKIELILKKQDTRSWTLLEKTNRDMGNINFTFGVGGRTGTIGAKQVILDNVNQAQHNVQHV